MKTARTSLLTIGILTLLLVGCGKSASDRMIEDAIERDTGGQADVDTSNGRVHVSTSEGTFDAGGNTLPDDWPTDVPAYAGATVQYTASANTGTDEAGSMAVLMTGDAVQTVVDSYTATLKTNGWKIGSTMRAQGSTILTATKGDRVVSLSITTADTQTSITIAVGKN